MLAAVWSNTVEEIIEEGGEKEEMWVPTKEDIAYQDSMYPHFFFFTTFFNNFFYCI
jgi:hypothetical protein